MASLFVLQLTVLFLMILAQVSGTIKYQGGIWNRPFRESNITVEDYIEDLSWRVGNKTAEDGLGLLLTPYSFKVNSTLLGITLKGDVRFENGVISKIGSIVPGAVAVYANRSVDLTVAYVYFTMRLQQTTELYDLKTDLLENNAGGTVEVFITDADFSFQLIHTFKTDENRVIVDDSGATLSFSSPPTWSIMPRNIQTYAIETLAKRDKDASTWYKNHLETWQKTILAPLIEDLSKGMKFPMIPY